MEQVTRQLIDARTQPVTITTLPASRSQVEVFLGSTAQTPMEQIEQYGHRIYSPVKAGVAIVVALVVAAGAFGFTLGWLGVGVSLLVSLAVAAAAWVALMMLLTLVGGSGGVGHCPGPWHR